MTGADALDRGRAGFERRAWRTAFTALLAADQVAALELDDLERLATAAFLIGDPTGIDLLVRAHHEAVRVDDRPRASRLAFWIAFELMDRTETAQASGWFSRASRLLDGLPESVEHGYLQLPSALQALDSHESDQALARFDEIARIAERHRDVDLETLARVGRGQALVQGAQVNEGMAFLDEAMVAVTADEVSPIVVGIIYCSVIDTCQRLFDLRRAQEWTDALARWCASQPDLLPYRGQCLLYRAQLMQLHGNWLDASVEARRAHELLAQPPVDPATGAAAYQEGDLHRLRGEFAKAEAAYRSARLHGYLPEPGTALLRFARGEVGAASTLIRRALDEVSDPLTRPRLLDACVEITLAAGDLAAAAEASAELAEIARRFRAPALDALAARAEGALRLTGNDAARALGPLRAAVRTWQEINAPYETARTRELIGLASRALGDDDTASLEFEAARETYRQLGARPDLARLVDALTGHADRPAVGGLTERELEVVRLVAAGKTNRAIASDLGISEKTVARHVSNIFNKLGISSRSGATAYAYEHHIVRSST